MIYLDNSATTFPKPQCVIDAVTNSIIKYGNYGRSGYEMAIKTTEQVHECRKKVANFFNATIENVVFTHNCTTALNMAIKGVAFKGCHFIISDLEHNAVLRPLETMKQKGLCSYSVARIENNPYRTIKNFENCIEKNTVSIICIGASNVFGIMTPYRLIGDLAHRYKLKFILDGAQITGVKKIDMQRDNIDILCCAGHKGLYGPSGVGLLVVKDGTELDTIIEGGTGSNSRDYSQPDFLPDRFESGTPNVVGILGLSSALDFVEKQGVENIYKHEMGLIKYLYNSIKFDDRFTVYSELSDLNKSFVPILSLNVKSLPSDEVAKLLAEDNICVRAGLHCAPLAHKKFGTEKNGVIRISPSIFTKKMQIDFTINSLFKIAK